MYMQFMQTIEMQNLDGEGQTTVQYNFSYLGSMGQEGGGGGGGGVHNVEMSITENMYIVYSHVATHYNIIN